MTKRRAARDIALVAGLIVGLVVLLALVWYTGPDKVVALGTSMLPTIEDWDVLHVDAQAYDLEPPERGDIVILKHKPDQPLRNAKRVIGLPGETVTISGGSVYIEGERLVEPYLSPGTMTPSPKTEYRVPDGHYFVLGDNREVSMDSRHFGFIPLEWISGKALV
jgi:signal peptidase I